MRRAFSLTELLVAMTIALMVMGAVATLFGVFGRGLSGSQATVELTTKVRAASWQLRKDLAGLTCDVVPWLAPEADAGYFEYIEGRRYDINLTGSNSTSVANNGTADLEADTDDVLLFTTRALADPFVGTVIVNGTSQGTAESDRAEVAWFCKAAPDQPVTGLTMHNLYRRQLLVSAVPGAGAFSAAAWISGTNGAPWSIRTVSGTSYANSLGDLTKREHRFHRAPTFPFEFLGSAAAGATFDGTDQEGEDVVLTNVIAFDVRAFDPESGTYVDLGLDTRSPSLAFAPFLPLDIGDPWPPNGQTATQSDGLKISNRNTDPIKQFSNPTYDTWSCHYEFGNPPAEGFSDPGQYTRGPPYPVPLRGIEVRIRCYEPTSKQIRQITVRHSFVKK
jgi:prepilin-type N-terminal cleavage/methylation domain-containing protein